MSTRSGQLHADVAGARVWDDTLVTIASWRTKHHIAPTVAGLGARQPDNPEWQTLTEHIAHTRQWLATTDRTAPAWPIVASHDELLERRQQLDPILATAPDDCRHTLRQLTNGQLTLTDLNELFNSAVDQQQQRRTWIIEHWPHIVEHHEINRTLTTATWGPDARALLAPLAGAGVSRELQVEIEQDQTWLRAALSTIARPDDESLDDTRVELLERIVEYRAARNITDTHPLGAAPVHATDAWATLNDELHHAAAATGTERQVVGVLDIV